MLRSRRVVADDRVAEGEVVRSDVAVERPPFSPAQLIALAIGIFFTVVGGVALARTGIDANKHHEGALTEHIDRNTWVTMSVQRSVDDVQSRLQDGLAFLATVGSTAPFVGLFGTVFGIITAFQSMSTGDGGGGLATVSAGISEALLTTAVGLAVAIVSVWFYNFFTNKVDDLTLDIDETASELVDSIIRETDGVLEATAG